MDRRFRRTRALVFAVAGTLSWAGALAAAPKDDAATKLADQAINTDYLTTDFAEAEKKLRSAAALCGAAACSPKVRARVQRDLGVVLIAGLSRLDDGKRAFIEALQADPNIGLEKALTTPEIEQIFRAAKVGGYAPAARPVAAAPVAAAAASPAAPAAAPAAAAGDMVHTPAAEQKALTPVPIYVELPAGAVAVKVVARYKPYGTSEWKTLELRRLGPGYGAEVPCRDVGSTTGDFLYFVQATDATGDVVSMSGSRATPNKVPIKNALTGEPPHLPGVVPPTKCADSADCPPGLPGCPVGKTVAAKAWGAGCEQDSECNQGLLCKNGVCDSGEKTDSDEPKSSGKMCDSFAGCDAGETCTTDKVCRRDEVAQKPKRVWLSLNIGQDISFVGSQGNVCGSQQNLPPEQYTCIDQDGFAYRGVPETGGPGTGNAIKGGPDLATTRIMAGLDFLIADNVTLGARLGYAFGVAPGRPLSHFHGEARAAFWFGKASFTHQRVRPFLVVVGGVAEIDNKIDVPILETDLRKGLYDTQTLTVWRQAGVAFAGGGGGVLIPIGAGQGMLAELKVQALFPDVAVAVAPSIGYALGF
jgi:hypothetical protein